MDKIETSSDLGMIAYFDGPCPNGWVDFEEAQGRFVIALDDVDYKLMDKGFQYRDFYRNSFAEPEETTPYIALRACKKVNDFSYEKLIEELNLLSSKYNDLFQENTLLSERVQKLESSTFWDTFKNLLPWL